MRWSYKPSILHKLREKALGKKQLSKHKTSWFQVTLINLDNTL